MILFILQNTYEYLTNTPEWEAALWRSHTGKRLSRMIPNGVAFHVTNATQEIGYGPNSACKPDPDHIRREIKLLDPDIVVTCGAFAQMALNEMDIPHIPIPHPAWRGLSNARIDEIREMLQACVA